MSRRQSVVGVRVLIFFLSLLPFIYLMVLGLRGGLGPDPGAVLADQTGQWALRFLLLVLLLGSLHALGIIRQAIRFRRMLGLYAFFYASLHVLVFLALLLGWDIVALGSEVAERPYVLLGALAYCMLLPLALTSSDRMMRVLRRRWKLLHRLVYPALCCVLLHFLWVIRADSGEFIPYGLLGVLLLLHRIFAWKWRWRNIG